MRATSHTGDDGPDLRIRGALGGTRTPNLLIRSYFTSPNLRLKTPALTLVVRPLKSAEVRRFPSRLRYFAAVLLGFLVAELSAAAEA